MVNVELAPVEAGREVPTRLTVRNGSSESIAFTRMQLESPSLAFEVFDVDGRPVPLLPPPAPDPAAVPVVLEPGESWQVDHVGVVPDHAVPGRYRVRARVFLRGGAEPLYSEWYAISI